MPARLRASNKTPICHQGNMRRTLSLDELPQSAKTRHEASDELSEPSIDYAPPSLLYSYFIRTALA
jgi:hypothetical protein